MFVIMGGTGHVGSATASELLKQGCEVAVVTHDPAGAPEWRARGARVIEADVDDVPSLRAAFACGKRALLLNPPADTGKDTDAAERHTIANILAALEGSGLEKVVAVSTAGAQAGDRIGDLNVLWEFEEGLHRQGIPAAINRGAYYMSNWDGLLEVARRDGVLPTMIPANMKLPMVAPADLGRAAAERLLSPLDETGIRCIEGPERYSPADVAAAFSQVLGRRVELAVTPRDQWREAFQKMGFSEAAADSYARMTAISVDQEFKAAHDAWRGSTSLAAYVRMLAAR